MSDKMIALKEGATGSLIFNNPERHNAVSLAMYERAIEILRDFAADDNIRVVVISGAGEKAFISGADISKFEDERASADAVAYYNKTVEEINDLVHKFPKPTIVKVQGHCLGGGVALAASADIRICSDRARFAMPAAKLSLGYSVNNIARLIALIGPGATKDIFFTAAPFDSKFALEIGFVNRAVPFAELDDFVANYAATVAENAPLTLRAMKSAVAELSKPESERNLAVTNELVARCFASSDYIEGRKAFMEKRKPNFQGR